METSLLYKLPKDILVKLLEKTYDFNEIPIKDIKNIVTICLKKLKDEKTKLQQSFKKEYKINNLTIRTDINKKIIIEPIISINNISIDIYPLQCYIISSLFGDKLYQFKNYEEFQEKLIKSLIEYDDSTINEILKTVRLIKDNIHQLDSLNQFIYNLISLSQNID